MKTIKLLLLASLFGCATFPDSNTRPPTIPTNYKERTGKIIEGCVVRLVREGIDEEIAVQACYKIYGKCNK